MSNISPLQLFYSIFKATLLSTGGTGNLPALHDDLVTLRHWATEGQIAEALALGQVCPGPTGLWVVCLGYLLDGVRGGVIAALAVALPPLLILLVERAYRRYQEHVAIDGFVTGLGLTVVGIGFVVLGRVFVGSGGVTLLRVLIAVVSATLLASRRVPFLLILIMAAIVGGFVK